MKAPSLTPNPAPWFGTDPKRPQEYRGLRVCADTHLHDQIFDLVTRILPSSRTGGPGPRLVADLGCGQGALAQRLSDQGYRVIAVDIEEHGFQASGAEFYPLNLDDAASRTTFADRWANQVDLVLAVEIIEHLRSPWNFLAFCHRLAQPKGHLIVTTPNVASWWSRLWFFIRGEPWGFGPESWYDPGHIHAFTHTELSHMLEECGFEVQAVYPAGNLPVIWAYNWKRLLASLLMLPLRPLMRGFKDGWVLCYHALKR